MKTSSLGYKAIRRGLVALVVALLTGTSMSAGAVLMQGEFKGHVRSLSVNGGEDAAAALAGLGVEIGDSVGVRFQYESSQASDGRPELSYLGGYNFSPAGVLNWMETTIGEHTWLSGSNTYFSAYVLNDFEYKSSGIFIDALGFSAYENFTQYPGAFACEFPCPFFSTGFDFEIANAAPSFMTSDSLPVSALTFPSGLSRHQGDIWIEMGWQIIYEIDETTVVMTAVPEPETYAMLLAGLGVLSFMAKRRKQKAA